MTISADVLKPGAAALSSLTLALGVLILAASLPSVLFPVPMARLWRSFPRSVWPGRVFAAIALAWAALWLQAMPLGPLTPVKAWLPVLTPVAVVAVAVFVDELLSCRALGGLLVLVPAPLLSAAQWHPSRWRFLILAIAYAMAAKGMYAIAAPYRMRDAVEWATRTPGRLRFLSVLDAALGLLLVGLAVTVLRLR